MPASPGRIAAVRTLVELETRGGHADDRFAVHAADLDDRERRLGWTLVLGVERNRIALDHGLTPHLDRPVARLDPVVRAILRSAAVQLRELDRVPERAVVHQAVELARALGFGRASGLVNAVLRSALRDPDAAGTPTAPHVVHSMPRWLLRRLPEGAAGAFGEPPAMGLRPRDAALAEELRAAGIDVQRLPGTLDEQVGALIVPPGDPRALPGWREGRFAVQDAAAQAVVRLVGACPGERVLDACAAPGGKALALADAVGVDGAVVALDLSRERLARMDAERDRLAPAAPVRAEVGDATDPDRIAQLGGPFDRVLVDAPCSALGTLRRHPELRWQRRDADPARFAPRQRALLAGAAAAVRPGGTLVYAVCSFAREEGPEVVSAFLAADDRFARRPIAAAWAPARTADGDLACGPHQAPWDAFYAAVLTRRR